MALNNRNKLSPSSGSQKPEISTTVPKSRYWQGYSPAEDLEENLFLASSSF